MLLQKSMMKGDSTVDEQKNQNHVSTKVRANNKFEF